MRGIIHRILIAALTNTGAIMGILGILLDNKNLIIGLILVSLLAGGYGYIRILKADNAQLVAEKANIKTQLDESQANLLQLQNDIKAQNDAIDKLKSDADVRLAKSAAEIKKAKDLAAGYKAQADDIMKRQPAPGADKCTAANDLFNMEIKDAKK